MEIVTVREREGDWAKGRGGEKMKERRKDGSEEN